ncbi:PTS sugar transporter subunit IIA [Sodalis sp. C49]|uniref:PTS sugar transporter subunit IIA n=1 Tax=unclassified Sodalis (in: enterobacteria) TaxID=2636512 RepID=UPI003965C8B5
MMFSAERVFTITQPISRDELLTLMADSLYADGLVKASFRQGVLDREAVYPTGIDMETHSIAIPHTEFEHVLATGFAVAVNQAGVEFHRTDEPQAVVKPAVVVLMAIDPSCEKVAIIQSLFALLGDIEQVNKIGGNSPEGIAKLFTESITTR